MKYLFLIQLVLSLICLSCTEVIRTKNENILKPLSPDEFISSDTLWNNKSISLIRYNKTSLDISKIKIFDEYDSSYFLNNDLVYEDYKRYILNEVHYFNNKNKIDSIEYNHYEYIFRIDAETGDLEEKILFIPDSTILAI
jgi:hypothetical protein